MYDLIIIPKKLIKALKAIVEFINVHLTRIFYA